MNQVIINEIAQKILLEEQIIFKNYALYFGIGNIIFLAFVAWIAKLRSERKSKSLWMDFNKIHHYVGIYNTYRGGVICKERHIFYNGQVWTDTPAERARLQRKILSKALTDKITLLEVEHVLKYTDSDLTPKIQNNQIKEVEPDTEVSETEEETNTIILSRLAM